MTAITLARSEILTAAAQRLSKAKRIAASDPHFMNHAWVQDCQETYDIAFQQYTNPFRVSKWV